MQEDLNLIPAAQEPEPGCVQCGHPEIVEGHSTKLCADCRTSFIKFPVPLWVKLFGAAIIVLILVSLVLSPSNFEAALALSRAEKAESAKNFISEQEQLKKVLNVVPSSVQASAHLLISSFYNGDFKTYGEMLEKLQGKNLEDADLLERINGLTAKANGYFPSEALRKVVEPYVKSANGVPDTTYSNYIKRQPGDVFAIYAYAASYFGKENYKKCDSLLAGAQAIDPDHMYVLFMRSIAKRELNQLDSSLFYCNKLLQENHQSVLALSSKARTLLKRGDNKTGLDLALQANAFDKAEPYNKATLAIAYHFNNKLKERDAVLKEAEKDSTLTQSMTYAKDIIGGKIKFRNQ